VGPGESLGRLGTSSYRLWNPTMGAPVRTNLGAPRWLQAPLIEWPTVYPWGLFGAGHDPDTLRRAYRHRLHRRGRRCLYELQELREAYGDLVLLCFEAPGVFCHRLVLGEWLAEHLGEPVEEVMPTPP
jgi:hypothetical protein